MKRLLMQADDFGITGGVAAGILKAIDFGLIQNTGLFVNMPYSEQAASEIKDVDVCLGIDINYVCGKPVTDPQDVPHLVDDQGNFYTSGVMAHRSPLVSVDETGLISTFETDPYPYDEILLETENQVKRFIELIGRKPAYIHPHSLMTPNSYRAQREVARKYNIMHTLDMMHQCRILPGTFDGMKGEKLEDQLNYDVTANLIERALPTMKDDEICYFICHAGYVDYELFKHTTLTLRRARDLDAMLSITLKDYLESHQISLITYQDLYHLIETE